MNQVDVKMWKTWSRSSAVDETRAEAGVVAGVDLAIAVT